MQKNHVIVIFGSWVQNTCPKISLSLLKGYDEDLIPGIPSQNHRITEWLRLEGTSRGPCSLLKEDQLCPRVSTCVLCPGDF